MLIGAPTVPRRLHQLSLAVATNTIVFEDFERARTGYVHHTSVPMAALAFTLAEQTFGRGRFPALTLLDVVVKRSSMDGEEIMTFAALGGVARLPPWSEHEHAFGIAVWRAVDKYDLHELFTHAPSCRPPPSYHALRPRGFDWTSPEWPEIPGAILQWRRQYKSLSLARQLVAATVLTLYRGEVDRVWLNRVPKAWPAADGIVALRDAGALMDWTELVALYPGW